MKYVTHKTCGTAIVMRQTSDDVNGFTKAPYCPGPCQRFLELAELSSMGPYSVALPEDTCTQPHP